MADLINTYYINKANKELNDKIAGLWEYLNNIGGFKKYVVAGTHTFIIPPGVGTIYVSGIGGGGGGAGGGGACNYSSTLLNAGSGGGGGGSGYPVRDQSITVTPGETLTVIVGEKGLGGYGGESDEYRATNGGRGGNGTDTLLKRGYDTLFTAQKGTGGNPGIGGRNTNTGVSGGLGGSLAGGDGGDSTKYSSDTSYKYPGSGGSAGASGSFGSYGNGGKGGAGAYPSLASPGPGSDGAAGTDGALVICFGGYRYNDIRW